MNCPAGPSDTTHHQPASLSQLSSRRLGGAIEQPPLLMSCRGRAEAFARTLQSRLRTLGSQDPPQDSPTSDISEAPPTFFDLTSAGEESPESPGSPAGCEYQRLIETAAHTPLEEAPPLFYDPEVSEVSDESETNRGSGVEFFDCQGADRGATNEQISATPSVSSSQCDSLPPSQSSTISISQQDEAPPPYALIVDAAEPVMPAPSEGEEGEEEEEEDHRPRVRRCSSLKTGKTPPGTPGRKKIVRFADVLGLDLAAVRHFLDEVPRVPRSAFEDLCVDVTDGAAEQKSEAPPTKVLVALFAQPGAAANFWERVRSQQVCLESACSRSVEQMTVGGCVRVRNLDFHKSVHVRYTLDDWHSFSDLSATYVENSCDGFSDLFQFEVYGGPLHEGQRLELAVRYQVKGDQYWDSNSGANYCFQCLPCASGAPATAAPGTEMASPLSCDSYTQLAGTDVGGSANGGRGRDVQWSNAFLY